MSRNSPGSVAAGLALKFVIDRIPPPSSDPEGRGGRRRRRRHPAPPPGRPRGALVTFALACLVATVVLMFGFEVTPTRIAGVIAMLAFIASGVFLIASPAYLDDVPEEEEE